MTSFEMPSQHFHGETEENMKNRSEDSLLCVKDTYLGLMNTKQDF
jgi:hypothetical protein